MNDTVQPAVPAMPPGKEWLFWRLHLGGWLAFGCLQFLLGLNYLPPLQDLGNRAAMCVVGILCGLALRVVYRRLGVCGMSTARAGASILAASILMGAVMSLAMDAVEWLPFATTGEQTRDSMYWINLEFTWSVFLLGWSILYVGINYRLDADEQRVRAVRAEGLAQQARLQALRAQLEPHFLFNTLNAIATLVMEHDNPAALAMLNNLSRFLRMTLDQAGSAEISVAEELEFARRYAEIQQTRFGDRLQMDFEVEQSVMQARVPALILQPLVENAVKHGVLSQERPGRVSVSIRADAGRLSICVQDDGPGFGSAPVRHGVGLANTAARLEALYGGDARLSLGAASGRGSAVRIELPLHGKAA